jgi:predicted HAD superfamily phosphohydrolase
VKSLTYQLTDSNDIYHIMDVAAFYKKNPGLCVTDLTKGQKVQVKISEFDRDIVTKVRQRSGYDNEYFLK